ncbi:hypothetical protein QBC43DRAFT_365981 [Cladorrhinum sp. PSN259]|nr:hypothetical protein QBC43DRAFT_365981 [Cladorrhinum sp. PSN259]
MEVWYNTNIYTTNPVRWVELMNLSTSEFSIGSLPHNLIAIPGRLRDIGSSTQNETIVIPPGSLVIERASRTLIKSRNIESVIFGAASGLVILVMIIWIAIHLACGLPLIHPKRGASSMSCCWRRRDGRRDAESSGGGTSNTAAESGYEYLGGMQHHEMSADRFKRELDKYYKCVPEIELYKESLEKGDKPEPIDVEKVTELLRRRYHLRIMLLSAPVETAKMLKMHQDAEDLKAEFEKVLQGWLADGRSSRRGRNLGEWTQEELEELEEMCGMITGKGQDGRGGG